jgi:membrane associated rhomboid family serine protease
MSIYERDYQKDGQDRQGYFSSGGPFSNLPPMTRCILIINVAVFLVTFLVPPLHRWINLLFSVYPVNYWGALQVWRLITYQFIHHDFFHVFFNMLMLYFLGPLLEGFWGPRLFLRFYLISGAMGGIVYTLLVLFGPLPAGPMVGASGAIYGLMAVTAVMFPRMQVYLFGIIPMNMVTLLGLAALISVMNFLSGTNAGGEAAHLTGMGVGLFYAYVKPRITTLRMTRSKGALERKIKQQQDFEAEVDRVLEKVHQSGIGSLSRAEKKTLQEATRREQQQTAQSR